MVKAGFFILYRGAVHVQLSLSLTFSFWFILICYKGADFHSRAFWCLLPHCKLLVSHLAWLEFINIQSSGVTTDVTNSCPPGHESELAWVWVMWMPVLHTLLQTHAAKPSYSGILSSQMRCPNRATTNPFILFDCMSPPVVENLLK